MPQKLLFPLPRGLGDSILLTALARDVQLAYPGRFEIATQTSWQPVWKNNPHVVENSRPFRRAAKRLDLSYRAGMIASQGGLKIHFLTWFHELFRRQMNLGVPVTKPYGDLHLDEHEHRPFVSCRYWVLFAGGKADMTTKHWNYERYQELANVLREAGIRLVQCGATHKGHVHAPLEGVLDLVGQTENVRDLFTLIAHADGVICPITSAMHIAACFEKPCVVIAGGREEPTWEAYVNLPGVLNFGDASGQVRVPHRYLHTVGSLHCCMTRGCWKRRVVPLEAADLSPERLRDHCLEPRRLPTGQAVAGCMEMISVEHVREAVMSYYSDGTLAPVAQPTQPAPSLIRQPEPAPRSTFVRLAISGPPDIPDTSQAPGIASSPAIAGPPDPVRTFEEPTLIRSPSVVRERTEASRTPHVEFNTKRPVPANRAQRCENILDHPIIGGGLTIFVLTYGNFPTLAKRCLDSILRTVPVDKCPIRVLANACSKETLDYLQTLPLDHVYRSDVNLGKYPMMRRAFWDEQCPITTEYIVWFDDDSHCMDPNWLSKLCQGIIAHHPKKARLFGRKLMHNLAIYMKGGHHPETWFRQATWWKKRPLRTLQGREAPNGTVTNFVTGGWWALGVDALRAGDIPDIRLHHRGGDITIGEQVHQAGFDIFNLMSDKKALVAWSDAPKRGINHIFPWAPEGSALPN